MNQELKVTGKGAREAVALADLPSDPSHPLDIASSARKWRDQREEAIHRDVRAEHLHEVELAREEGYRQGLLDGRAAAEAEGLEILSGLDEKLEKAKQEAQAQCEAVIAESSPFIVETALEIARWAIGREVESDPALLLEIADRALHAAGGVSGAQVHVPPSLGAAATRFSARFGIDRPDIVEDPSLPDGCISLRSRSGGVGEVSVHTLVARACEALHINPEQTRGTIHGDS